MRSKFFASSFSFLRVSALLNGCSLMIIKSLVGFIFNVLNSKYDNGLEAKIKIKKKDVYDEGFKYLFILRASISGLTVNNLIFIFIKGFDLAKQRYCSSAQINQGIWLSFSNARLHFCFTNEKRDDKRNPGLLFFSFFNFLKIYLKVFKFWFKDSF